MPQQGLVEKLEISREGVCEAIVMYVRSREINCSVYLGEIP